MQATCSFVKWINSHIIHADLSLNCECWKKTFIFFQFQEPNLLGFKGPRRMTVLIPELPSNMNLVVSVWRLNHLYSHSINVTVWICLARIQSRFWKAGNRIRMCVAYWNFTTKSPCGMKVRWFKFATTVKNYHALYRWCIIKLHTSGSQSISIKCLARAQCISQICQSI